MILEAATPQEVQIALVVAEGKTNREVGAQLFLSPKTVEWHLGHIYRKLGLRSRAQLGRALEGDTSRTSGVPITPTQGQNSSPGR